MRCTVLLSWVMGAMAIVGCSADDSDDGASGESGTGTDGSGSTTTDGSATSVSASVSESTGGSASATEGSTGIDPSTTGDTGSVDDSGSGDSESTGAADECAGLDRVMCMRNASCAPIGCRPIVEGTGGALYCTDDAEFVGCQSADTACAEVITVGCDGDDGAPYVCSNACLPAGWNQCDPPIDGEIPMCQA